MSSLPAILLSVAMVVSGQTLLKTGMTRVGPVDGARLRRPLQLALAVARTPAVVVGLSLYVASAVSWIYVLSRTDLSFAYPFLAVSYVAVTLVAVLGLKERFHLLQWAGVALVVAGVVLVALSGT
jgi:drug/metabolite transporter (DMT)-like permease